MPLTYGYEQGLIRPTMELAGRTGYAQGVAEARRFGAQLQQQYDQMAQQRYMQQQQMMQQRWMQGADQANSLQRIAAQGNINQQLQQSSQAHDMERMRLGNQLEMQSQSEYMRLRDEYNAKAQERELNMVGQARRQSIETDLQMIQQAEDSHLLTPIQAFEARQGVYKKAAGTDWSQYYKAPGDAGTTWRANGHMWATMEDGSYTDMGPITPQTIEQQISSGELSALDANMRQIDPAAGPVDMNNVAWVEKREFRGGQWTSEYVEAPWRVAEREQKQMQQQEAVKYRVSVQNAVADAQSNYVDYMKALPKDEVTGEVKLPDGTKLLQPSDFLRMFGVPLDANGAPIYEMPLPPTATPSPPGAGAGSAGMRQSLAPWMQDAGVPVSGATRGSIQDILQQSGSNPGAIGQPNAPVQQTAVIKQVAKDRAVQNIMNNLGKNREDAERFANIIPVAASAQEVMKIGATAPTGSYFILPNGKLARVKERK